ncbi:MAG: carbon-nitrogen hydrolase family protein [Candidatus Bathyarchaeia archaeon]
MDKVENGIYGGYMARYVHVSTISFSGAGFSEIGESPKSRAERNLEEAIKLLKRAALDKPDIVCLPEAFITLGLEIKNWLQIAESVPGPTTNAIGEVARQFNMYVICPIIERKDGKIYNSAVLINRQGKPVGSYYKMHPTIGEIKGGVTPGANPTVFQTDFGRIGCAICFDLNFEDVIKGLAANGAEIVFFPSMYRGGLQLSIWAFNFGIYMVSAYTGEGSMIVNPLGKVVASSSIHEPIISKTINLDYKILHIDYNRDKWEGIKSKYGPHVEIDVASSEGVFLLISHLQNISVERIIEEFQLETREQYFNRALNIRNSALKN